MKLNRMKLLELKKSQMNFSQIRLGKGNVNRHGNGNDIEKMMKLSETLLSEIITSKT